MLFSRYFFYFGLMTQIRTLTVPVGCVYDAGMFTCDFTTALPLNVSLFDPRPQRLKLTNINGSFTADDARDFDSMTSSVFNANYAPTLEMECSSGGDLILNASSFTGLFKDREREKKKCFI